MRREAFFPVLVLILLFGSIWVLQSNEKDPVIGPTTGCTDSTAENYNPSADVDDGSCTYSSQPVLGCTDLAATNYDPAATEDNGSCTYPPAPVLGCTNSSATNYDSAATEDDGSCTYPPQPVQGCTNSSATNYDPAATVDDGSCTYQPQPVQGCTNSSATNYDPAATVDDGSCTYPPAPVLGCTNSSATNYDPAATEDDGSCTYPPPSVPGCTDSNATNYDPAATVDDGSCVYPPVEGCTYPSATNYNPSAVVYNGSCIFPSPQVGLDNATIEQATGELRILVMMGKLSNQTPITTPQEEQAIMDFVGGWYENASFGHLTFNVTYTGWFNVSSLLLWKPDFWEETLNLGYDFEDYDLFVTATQGTSLGLPAGGSANSVGVGNITRTLSNGTTILVNGTFFGTYVFQPGYEGLIIHEFGHCLGLHHAGFTQGWTGLDHAYRNGDDLMGGGTLTLEHFSAPSKAKLGWIPEADVITTVENGTWFISDVEFPGATALRVPVPGDATGERWYWVGSRSADGNGDSTGELIRTYPHDNPGVVYGSAAFLASVDTWAIDATPETLTNTSGLDSHLLPARTWSDPTGSIHFTIASANQTGIWLQVRITDAAAQNQAPLITSITATIDPNNPFLVHYNVTAVDPEGGNLSVFWSAANAARYEQTYSSQSRFDSGFSISKEYNNNNSRRVWVYVSDMEGGVTRAWVDVFGYNNSAPDALNITRSIYDNLLVVFFSHYVDWDLCEVTWDFGDGSATSNGYTPMHTYAAAGTYTVTLTVSDGEFSTTVTRTINVT